MCLASCLYHCVLQNIESICSNQQYFLIGIKMAKTKKLQKTAKENEKIKNRDKKKGVKKTVVKKKEVKRIEVKKEELKKKEVKKVEVKKVEAKKVEAKKVEVKAGRANNRKSKTADESCPVDKLVWAKMRFCPFWPARICKPPPELKNTGKGKVCVFFFGSKN